jgi:Transposase DDE domain group 1
VGHQPPTQTRRWRGQPAYIDAAQRVHAWVEDAIRTGKDCGIGKFPSTSMAMNKALLAAALAAATLLAWLKLLALDGRLASAEPKTLRYLILHAAVRLALCGRRRRLKIDSSWPWAVGIVTAWNQISALPQAPDQRQPIPAIKEGTPGASGTPGHPARQPDCRHPPNTEKRPQTAGPTSPAPGQPRPESLRLGVRPFSVRYREGAARLFPRAAS